LLPRLPPPLQLLLMQVCTRVPAGSQCLLPVLLLRAAAAAATVLDGHLHPAHCRCKQQLLQLHALLLPLLRHRRVNCRRQCLLTQSQPAHVLCWVHLLLMA
jgi:hypothetical protein